MDCLRDCNSDDHGSVHRMGEPWSCWRSCLGLCRFRCGGIYQLSFVPSASGELNRADYFEPNTWSSTLKAAAATWVGNSGICIKSTSRSALRQPCQCRTLIGVHPIQHESDEHHCERDNRASRPAHRLLPRVLFRALSTKRRRTTGGCRCFSSISIEIWSAHLRKLSFHQSHQGLNIACHGECEAVVERTEQIVINRPHEARNPLSFS